MPPEKPLMLLMLGGQGSIQDAAGQQGAFDRIAGFAGVHHPLNPFEKISKVRMSRFQAFFEPRGERFRLVFESDCRRNATCETGQHEQGSLKAIDILKEEQGG